MSFILTKWWCISIVMLSLLTNAVPVKAQLLQSARLEIPLLRDDGEYEIVPAHESGVFLYRRFTADNLDQLEIFKLDTAFQQQWHGYLSIDKRSLIMGKRVENGKLYLLLKQQNLSRNNMTLFAIEEHTGNYVQYPIKNIIPFSPTEFQVTQEAAIIGGYFNRVPVVLHYSFTTEKSRLLPGLLNESGELTQVKTYDDGSFDVLISGKNFQRQQTIWIKNYDPTGELLRNYGLEPDENRNFLFARSLKTDNDMQVVAGVYGGRNPDYSKGLFIASIDPAGMQQVRYYNYGDLENFFKYMKAKREKRVKERIQRRKIKGKKIRFTYRFLVHELVPYNNQYVLLGEAFYPQYTTFDRSSSGLFSPYAYASNGYFRDGRIFDGYNYTHAVVMGFDQKGNLLWDNSFEINDVKTFTLEQFVKLEVQQDKIALLYLYENELRSKIIQDNKVLEGKSFEPLKTNSETEIVKKESKDPGKLEYWYGDYFYAYGTQEIINPRLGKRKVFFINKVSYR